MAEIKKVNEKIEGLEIVNFNEWSRMDLRVGKIISAEDIEGADKLYKLSVDLGKVIGKKTILAGIKPYYKKDALKGKNIIVLANLKPRSMKGLVSEGMLLAASDEDHEKVCLLQPDSDIEIGARVM